MDTCQSLIFSSLFENRGGLQAKLKTHGTFHLKGQPWRRGGLGSERVGVFLNTWSVSGNSRVIATTGQQGRACMVVCVFLHTAKSTSFNNLNLIFFFCIISSSCDNILFTIFILQTQGYSAACQFYVRDLGA